MSACTSALGRRDFLRVAGAGVLAAGGLAWLNACDRTLTGPAEEHDGLLRTPENVSAVGLTLIAAPGFAAAGGGGTVPAWLFNGGLPGPTIRTRRGGHAAITLHNDLPEATIVHWHGMIVPQESDGHPRFAVPTGVTYAYAFPVMQRAGTNWYHPHSHHHTAAQIHRGLAGFFIVTDEEERALELPSGRREILLMVQDRRVGPGGAFAYTPDVDDFATGFLGDVPFGNGVQRPRVRVTADQYRLRVLNGSAARVYRLALSTGAPLVAVGNDGGLLPAAVSVDDIYLGVAERIDVLVDLTTHAVGDRVTLRSLAFSGFGGNAGTAPQGTELDLLELEVVSGGGRQATVLPPALSTVPLLTAGEATNVRTFELASAVSGESHAHTINERSFDMYRVDEQISLGAIERWVFRNLSALPHPVHLHGTHFQVLSRTGGRSTVYPYEGGWKDTVLVMPSETVDVLVRFDAYRGIFPLHCHNLQHEDMGMMLNIEVV